MPLSRHNLETTAREVLIRDGISFDGLPAWKRLTLLSHAELADRTHEDIRAAIEECWRDMIDAIRLDGPEGLQGPHG